MDLIADVTITWFLSKNMVLLIHLKEREELNERLQLAQAGLSMKH